MSSKAKSKSGRVTKSSKCGLQFPVARVGRLLRKNKYANNIATGAAIYLTSVLEYLSAEVLELSGNAAQDNKKSRITPRHLQLAIGNDVELSELLKGVTISQGGVMPFIHSSLLPKKVHPVNNTSSQEV